MQTRINKFSARLLPLCVTHISFDATVLYEMQYEYNSALSESILKRYANLKQLEVYHPATLPKQPIAPDMATKANVMSHISMQISNSTEKVIQQLGKALYNKAAPKLEKLSISSVFFHTEATNAIGEVAAALISGACPKLQELLVGGNNLSDSGIGRIAEVLISGCCPNLQVLDLRRNAIGEKGIHALSDAIIAGRVPRLSKILLGGNILSDCCSPYIARMLYTGACSNLRSLTLDFNFLASEGVGEIAKALLNSKCRDLRFLDFAGNSTNDGAVQIAKVLEQNSCPMLTNIDVGNISEVGAQAIEDALRIRRCARDLS